MTVAQHDFDRAGVNAIREERTVEHERVELAVLPAGVDRRREVPEEAPVVPAPRERAGQPGPVDADDEGFVARVDELVCRPGCVAEPEREDGGAADRRKLLLTGAPHLLEKQVAEGDLPASCERRPLQLEPEEAHVLLVGAAIRQLDLDEPHAEALCLQAEKLSPDAVDADAPVPRVHGGEERRGRHAALTQRGQGEDAVLATAPRERQRRCEAMRTDAAVDAVAEAERSGVRRRIGTPAPLRLGAAAEPFGAEVAECGSELSHTPKSRRRFAALAPVASGWARPAHRSPWS